MRGQLQLLRTQAAALLLLMCTGPAEAQVDIDVPEGELAGNALQAVVYLQLYGHPATAHRRLDVRVQDEVILLSGEVNEESQRRTAERMVSLIARESAIVNRIMVRSKARQTRSLVTTAFESPAEARAAFRKQLAEKIDPPILKRLELAAYPVNLGAEEANRAWVPVVEGVVPTSRHQLAISKLLLSGSPPAAAVINHTYVVPSGRDGESLRIRVPFFSLDLDVDEGGVDLGMFSPAGPFHLRTGSRPDPRQDRALLGQFQRTVRSDPQIAEARLQPSVFGGVLSLHGDLTAAEKMRAVALSRNLRGLRGIVDATKMTTGGPPYFRETDLSAYLAYRLHEHAHAWDMRLQSANEGAIVQATVPTQFHADLAASVLAHEPALEGLVLKGDLTEWGGRRKSGGTPGR